MSYYGDCDEIREERDEARANLQSERAKVKALREALEKADEALAVYYGVGANADSRSAIAAALAATSDPIEAPSDVHPQESGV